MKIDVSKLPLKDCAELVAEDAWFFNLSRREGVEGRVVLNCVPLREDVGELVTHSPLELEASLPTIKW